MILQIFIFIISLCLLCGGADLLVRGSRQIARAVGVSGLVVGLTVVSLGTSAPELFISVVAALNGNADLAIGNIVGSNIANIGLVMALAAIVAGGIDFRHKRDFWVMLGLTFLTLPLMWDRRLGHWDGALLIIILCGYLFAVVWRAKARQTGRLELPSPEKPPQKSWAPLVFVVLGVTLLTFGSTLLRESVTVIATDLGVSELVIALTMVSVGTSLPELATSIMAVLKKEQGLAIGNIVGSNIFNLAFVLGITSVVSPIIISPEVLYKQYPAMLAITVLLLVLARLHKRISRFDGYVLMAVYLCIIGFTLFMEF